MNGTSNAYEGRHRQRATSEWPGKGAAPQPVPPQQNASDVRVRSHRRPDLPEWQHFALGVGAWVIDTVGHLGIGLLTFAAAYTVPDARNAALAAAIVTMLAVCFAHRVFIQHATGSTLGKAILGVRLENPDRSAVTRWELTKLWFMPLVVLEVLS
ncbi:RDD family protein [Nocardia heshunensis]